MDKVEKENSEIWCVLTNDQYGCETVQDWFDGKDAKEKAEKDAEECSEMWIDKEFWIEPGTHHIMGKCKGCQTVYAHERHDNYGIPTGNWCDDCYDSKKYPYRKDNYFDPAYAGERMDDDY